MVVESRFAHLGCAMEIQSMRRAHQDLRDDVVALIGCLEMRRLVHPHELHRMRFEAALARSELGAGPGLLEVLRVAGIGAVLEASAGASAPALRAASAAAAAALGGSTPPQRPREEAPERDPRSGPSTAALPASWRWRSMESLEAELCQTKAAVEELMSAQSRGAPGAPSLAAEKPPAGGRRMCSDVGASALPAAPGTPDGEEPLAARRSPEKGGEAGGRLPTSGWLQPKRTAGESEEQEEEEVEEVEEVEEEEEEEQRTVAEEESRSFILCTDPGRLTQITLDGAGEGGEGAHGPGIARWEVQPLQSSRMQEALCVTLGGVFYACGSVWRRLGCFDPAVSQWKTLAPLNSRRLYSAITVVGKFLYACGGQDNAGHSVLRSVERCGAGTMCVAGRWESLPCAMLARRQGLAATALDGHRLLVCGGSASVEDMRRIGPPSHDSVEVLDLSAGRPAWRWWPRMLSERVRHAVTRLRGSVFVCGGCDANSVSIAACERYDMESQVWSQLPPMRVARERSLAVASGGLLFVLGGERADCPTIDSRVAEYHFSGERYDPEAADWEVLFPREFVTNPEAQTEKRHLRAKSSRRRPRQVL